MIELYDMIPNLYEIGTFFEYSRFNYVITLTLNKYGLNLEKFKNYVQYYYDLLGVGINIRYVLKRDDGKIDYCLEVEII